MQMQEVETAAVMQVDPRLQEKFTRALAHFCQGRGAPDTNALFEERKVGPLQHRHVFAVPPLPIGSTRSLGASRAHRERGFSPPFQMGSQHREMSLPEPCREKIKGLQHRHRRGRRLRSGQAQILIREAEFSRHAPL